MRCTAGTPSSIDVAWQPPASGEHNGVIQHYRVHYELAGLAEPVHAPYKTVDGLHVTLSNLTPHSAYRVRVQAATRLGAGPLSAPINCVTDESGSVF